MLKRPTATNHTDSNRRGGSTESLARPAYPFVAVVGQEDMKLRLILNVVDPRIGGVLIMGHRGTAKSTAVRALTDLLPPIRVVADCSYQCDPKDELHLCDRCQSALNSNLRLRSKVRPVPLVELPLGATEDRVCGTINLERVLNEGATVLEPGLLARANRGFLYIDEVNLLEDHLVDLLLDVAASGVNRIEREGVSVEHPSRFVLIGSGNPEEGELRPQLLDRFGLHVEIKTEMDPELRVAVVECRDAFDRDPIKFNLRFADEQNELRKRIERARRSLTKINVSRELLGKAAQLCSQLGIEGHRGELTLIRAARALAGFEGRRKVTDDDLRRVAPMALRHRVRQSTFDDGSGTERIKEALKQIGSQSPQRSDDAGRLRSPSNNGQQSSDEGSRGNRTSNSLQVASSETAPVRVNLVPKISAGRSLQERKSSGKKRRSLSEKGGRHIRSTQLRTTAKKIAVVATIRALCLNACRNSVGSHVLRYKLFSRKQGSLFVFVIDTSGSMARNLIALAKSAILDVLRQSYMNRDSVAIVTFRGDTATVVLPPSRSILRARRVLDSLPV